MTQQELRTMKLEFSQGYQYIQQKVVSSTEKYIPQSLFDPAIQMKRMGKYAESNRAYVQLVMSTGAFTPNIAAAWVKVLACGGDMDDALNLCVYTIHEFAKNPAAAGSQFQMVVIRYIDYLQFICDNDISGLKQKLVADSGNPSYRISDSELDIVQSPELMKQWQEFGKNILSKFT